MDDSNFGAAGGLFSLNALKDVGAAGQTVLQNTGVMEPGQTDLQRQSSERAVFESDAGRDMAQTIRDFSGLVASDREAARVAKQTGQDVALFNAIAKTGDIGPFTKDKKVFLSVLRAAAQYEEERAAREATVVRDEGIRLPDAQGDVSALRNSMFEELVAGGMDKAAARAKVYEKYPK
jgi:hypothetical protein